MELQVGVKALIKNANDEYLLLKRAQPIVQGRITWDIPGGRINPEETLLSGLQREIKEETGIDIDTTGAAIINAQDIFIPEKSTHVIRVTYRLVATTIKVALSPEHSEYKFATLEEALALVDESELKSTLENLL